MTVKQRLLKLAYPLIMKLQQKQKEGNIMTNPNNVVPPVSFYSLEATSINGQPFSFSNLDGKKVMIVNVASNCGYTGQYSELETLYVQNKEKLIVLGFPANDFAEQEPGSNEEIASFCKLNFGVSFPLFQKQSVLNTKQHPVYDWLTNPSLNGWNAQSPTWNFCKYLVDETGKLEGFYAAPVSPLSAEITSKL